MKLMFVETESVPSPQVRSASVCMAAPGVALCPIA